MNVVLGTLRASAIIFIGAFLFTAVDWLEPNRWVAIVFKCVLLTAGAAAIANQVLPSGLLAAIDMGR